MTKDDKYVTQRNFFSVHQATWHFNSNDRRKRFNDKIQNHR